MEKTLSQEDRIRRAEEIYYRKNNINTARTATVSLAPQKEYKLFRKILIQIIVCVSIYFGVYWMGTQTDKFSVDSVGYIKGTLGYDADIKGWFNIAKNYIEVWLPKEEEKDNNVNVEETSISPEVTSKDEEETKEENIEVKEETSSISQMEQDAEYIKANFSIIKPVMGTITSRFGLRNPTTATVPKYHTGIDIAVNEGTVFIAAMDGTVEQVSSEGDYRKSYKNNQWRCNNALCTL